MSPTTEVMPMTDIVHRPSVFRRFRRDRRGVSAVEFALLAPLMITLYLGSTEISDGVGATRKVSLTAATVANLTAQEATITAAQMTTILNASAAVIAPYDANKLKIVVTGLKIDATGKATVDWSRTKNGTVRATNSTVTIPAALAVPNSYLVLSEVSFAYTPIVGHTITGTINLSDKMYMSPRQSLTITLT